MKILTILLLLSGCSAMQPVTPMEIVTDALLIADWNQTQQIAEDPINYFERNIIMGEHPPVKDVNTYFIGCLLVNTVVHRFVPKPYLRFYQAGLIMVQVGAIANNYNIGLKVDF